MISKFSVKNFKNFKDEVTIDFSNTRNYSFNDSLICNGLINKMIILGKNNSGKSNLGAAIMDITTHLTDNHEKNDIYMPYLCGNSLETFVEFKYEMVFNNKRVIYNYKKNASRALLYEELFIENELSFAYNYLTRKYENNIYEGTTVDITKYNNLGVSVLKFIYNNTLFWSDNNPFKLFMDFVNHMLWFRSLRGNEFMGFLPNGEDMNDFIINNNRLGDFELFLKSFDQDYKLCMMIGPFGKKIIGVQYKHFQASFFDVASTGTTTLCLLYYWIHRSEDNISFMYIDEFDAFYNYLLSRKVFDVIKKNKYQVVVTSHNLKLVSNDIMRPDCYLFLLDGKVLSLSDIVDNKIRKDNNLEKIVIDNNLIF